MRWKYIIARVPDSYEAIEVVRGAEQTDLSTVVMQLLERGVEDWRLDTAVWLEQDGTVPLGRAAELADISSQLLDHP